MSKPQKMKISSDSLVPRPFRNAPASREQRFYNWDSDGNHPPINGLSVAFDEWHIEMCVAGVCKCDGPEEAIRFVDQRARDKQLAKERKMGWHKLTHKQLKKMREDNSPPAKPELSAKAPQKDSK